MDGLTGLLNKRAMLEVADQKIASARRFGKQLSVLVTDIDHFKKVNDTYGHDVGACGKSWKRRPFTHKASSVRTGCRSGSASIG